jgi:hypothetical protein
MTPMFLTDRMVKKRSLSARSFQFLFIVAESWRRIKPAYDGLPSEWIRRDNFKNC